MPIVFAFVLGLAFLLMLLAFRSIVIPIKTVLLNLLSVWAAYGILVAVFQHTWAEGILGFTSNGAITSWLPLFLFVILFGLSMDYHVFILSRVKERVDAGESTEDAVAHAISRTAGTITSAALVMVGVFALFATIRLLPIKQLGFGLAVAVLPRRDDRARGAAPGGDEAARRLELVPAALARVAAVARGRSDEPPRASASAARGDSTDKLILIGRIR